MYVDIFSSLDELKGSSRSDPEKVLAVLKRVERFSYFEVDSHIASALRQLKEAGRIAYEPDAPKGRSAYPWKYVKIAPQAALSEGGR